MNKSQSCAWRSANNFTSSFTFGSYEISDYFITCLNFCLWIIFLFLANTLFSVIFLIELISSLIFLLISTSVFSSSYFYNHVIFTLNVYQFKLIATSYFTGLLFFFWMSLFASLGLFVFLVTFYTYFFAYDWNIIEFIFSYFLINSSLKNFCSFFAIWLLFFWCVFLKCGLVPFYLWKPTFFKSLPFHSLFFYVTFFYFFIFLFFTFFFSFCLNELFYFFAFIFNFLLLFGFLSLFAILCDSYYVKVFLSLSSILNTLFVFLVFSNMPINFFIIF